MTDPPPPPPGPSPPPPGGSPGPPPAYSPDAYADAYAAAPRTNGFAIASMVLGIVAIPLCFFLIPAVLAVVFGGVALGQFKNRPGVYSGRGMAVAGLVLGIVALVVFVVYLVAVIASRDGLR